jgi:hypothetical protein
MNNNKKKTILFLSKDNLTTNPRLKKELLLAVENGYNVIFYGFYTNNWSDEIEKSTIKNINAEFNYISATKKNFLKWFIASVLEFLAKKFYLIYKKSVFINTLAHSKKTILLLRKIKKIKVNIDLISAHTLPTLYPAYSFSRKLKIPFIFDVEDFHPGEVIQLNSDESIRRFFLLKNILPFADFITYASPFIGENIFKIIPEYEQNKHLLINNCFNQNEFCFKENNSGKVKFVWFSQNIAQGRGLEFIIPILYEFKDKVELFLIGNLYKDFYDNFLYQFKEVIKIENPLEQSLLNSKLSEFDIGLAIEMVDSDFNRNICLTNKIFAYIQSGLFVLATDTEAQKKFLKDNIEFGNFIEINYISASDEIRKIIDNIDIIRNNKMNRFENSKKMSWDFESEKVLRIWDNFFSKV